MPMEKRCIVKDCAADPRWGWGSALKGTIRFACSEHRDRLWSRDETPAVDLAAPPPGPRQMSLWGR